MPTHELHTPFFEGLIDGPQVEDLALALESLGMPQRWSGLCGAFIPALNLWCLRKNESGELPRSEEKIANICGWPLRRKAKAFVQALVKAGFLDEKKEGENHVTRYSVHNFRYYHRGLLKDRERKREKRKAEASVEMSVDATMDSAEERTREGTMEGTQTRPQSAADASALTRARDGNVYGNRNGNVSENGVAVVVRESDYSKETAGASPPLPDKAPDLNGKNGTQAKSGDVWQRWQLFAEVLRAEGWGDDHTRRMIRWAAKDYRGGAWREAPADHLWRLLAWAFHVAGAKTDGRGNAIRDRVAVWIHCCTKSGAPPESCEREAKAGWVMRENSMPARGPNAAGKRAKWLEGLLSGIGRAVVVPGAEEKQQGRIGCMV